MTSIVGTDTFEGSGYQKGYMSLADRLNNILTGFNGRGDDGC